MPLMSPRFQLVVFVFCTAGGQNHGVFRQCLCKIRVIAAALCTAVTSSHDNEFFDRAGFHGIDDLVCQGEYLCMGEASDNGSLLEFRRRCAVLCLFDEQREIFCITDDAVDVRASRITNRSGCVNTVL